MQPYFIVQNLCSQLAIPVLLFQEESVELDNSNVCVSKILTWHNEHLDCNFNLLFGFYYCRCACAIAGVKMGLPI
jgi:hypothetical protein